MELAGRTAVVTGGASGIGRALAETIHERGARLVLADRDVEGMQQVAGDTGARAIEVDVSVAEDVERLAEAVGAPTLLCLNAGVVSSWSGPVWEAPPEEWRRVLDINLGGVVNGLRSFVPRMIATGEAHHILITASLAGLLTWPGGGPYAAAKHAVVTVAEQAALALQDSAITVTLLCPALVRTGMSDVGDDPQVVASKAVQALDQGSFAVFPDDWEQALLERARRLAAGHSPLLPAPG